MPGPAGDVGADAFGRVDFAGYFRPPGAAGLVSVGSGSGAPTGAIVYPSANNDLFYTSGPNPANLTFPAYLPDVTNNPLHGFESSKNPNLLDANGALSPQTNGGMPADQNVTAGIPIDYPTYDLNIRTNGLNDADEMSLYQPNALMDMLYGPADLEWLYRPQDVDGSALSSRLAKLAPVSFTNSIDGVRRRRLFALEGWESNQFIWANDNPQNAFPLNSRFAPTANASFAVASAALGSYVAAPSVAHRDRKINLNYPLPVSNDPDEPIRHKWITETYQLLKWILPPRAVDTPEELAQLSQFVINIIDFRDPDCTMTHWLNPDVQLVPGQPANPSGTRPCPRRPPRWFWPPPIQPTPFPWTNMAWSTTRSPSTKYSHFHMHTTVAAAAARRPTGFSSSWSIRCRSRHSRPCRRQRPVVRTHPTPASSTWAGSSTRRVIRIRAAAGTWSSPTTRPTAVPIPTAASWSREASTTL